MNYSCAAFDFDRRRLPRQRTHACVYHIRVCNMCVCVYVCSLIESCQLWRRCSGPTVPPVGISPRSATENGWKARLCAGETLYNGVQRVFACDVIIHHCLSLISHSGSITSPFSSSPLSLSLSVESLTSPPSGEKHFYLSIAAPIVALHAHSCFRMIPRTNTILRPKFCSYKTWISSSPEIGAESDYATRQWTHGDWSSTETCWMG